MQGIPFEYLQKKSTAFLKNYKNVKIQKCT
uniref:Uncharacterized protein n=1 Tax=Anguilla anguilla TaxID=7936 RepID=A0A0E9UKV1_ANGAN